MESITAQQIDIAYNDTLIVKELDLQIPQWTDYLDYWSQWMR
ncbi:hypothetical protein [Paenibacillus sp. NPDC058071]